jgi:hypothetical protein
VISLKNATIDKPRWATAEEKLSVIESGYPKTLFAGESIEAEHCFTIRAKGRDYAVFPIPDAALLPLYMMLSKTKIDQPEIQQLEKALDVVVDEQTMFAHATKMANPEHVELIKNIEVQKTYALKTRTLIFVLFFAYTLGLVYAHTELPAVASFSAALIFIFSLYAQRNFKRVDDFVGLNAHS